MANTCTLGQVANVKYRSCSERRSEARLIIDLLCGRRYRAMKMMSVPIPVQTLLSLSTDTNSSAANGDLSQYYKSVLAAHGPQHWWPGRSAFEIIVGAILTQGTSWTNVEMAIKNLRHEKILTPPAVKAVAVARLARLIQSSGYFRQKAKTLKCFVRFLYREYGGSLARMFRSSTQELREKLLAVHGIGPETADSILLYAGKHRTFVVDAYTRRMLERHQLAAPGHSYDEIRQLLERSLPKDVALYNEFHALIVRTGKEYCRKRNPRCSECPLHSILPQAVQASL